MFGTNTRRRNVTIDVAEGPGTATFRFDRFPMLEGVYDLNAAVTDHTEIHPFDRWDGALRFEVDQSGIYDQGSVVADGTWTVESRSSRRIDHSSSARR
jgi:hypothetical protein